MGALPKRRISTRRKGKRRIGHKMATKNIVVCKNCGADRLPHQQCPSCGQY